MPYIEVIDHVAAEGELKDIYDDLVRSRGKLAQVHQIQSLNPESILRHMELYMTIMFGKSPLRRARREMIAVVVSLANDCPYCITHHAEALLHFWKDKERLDVFVTDYRNAGLEPADLALCDFARQLTKQPGDSNAKGVEALRALGLGDREILDATLVVAYFNFVNRMVLGLGVELEADGGGGYEYD